MKTASSRPNILIVDDVPANIRLLQIALTPDYEISACTNGPEAVEIARSVIPDLILLDIMMPEISGYEVCRRLKADSLTSDIPVIFITARSEEQEETHGFELGAVDYITKPFSPAIVRSRVGIHLELKHHRDRLSKANALLKQEIAKQKISISLAKKLLEMINGTVQRHTDISRGLTLFAHLVSVPCYAEGGDHCLVRNMIGGEGSGVRGQGSPRTPDPEPRTPNKTVISIKDQSGHEVSCILRSIMTDLIHNIILKTQHRLSPQAVFSKLNDEICHSQLFDSADFFTSLTAEIDHETLVLRYVSAGHPPFLLIRGNEIREIPVVGAAGTNLPAAVKPGIVYSAGEIQLEEKDRLIFYTDGLTEMPVRKKKKMITSAELKTIARQVMFGSAPLTAPVVEPVETEPVETPVSEIMERMLAHIADISDEIVIPGAAGRAAKNTSADDITMLGLEIENAQNASEAVWHPADAEQLCRNAAALYEKFEQEWHRRGYENPMLRLRIVMEESLLNAWIHGNRKNPDKAVRVRWQWGNDFCFEVGDEGDGFDADAVPDPTLRENLIKPCGRGIFFIRCFADQVLWKKEGRHIITYFKKHPDADSEKSAKTASVF